MSTRTKTQAREKRQARRIARTNEQRRRGHAKRQDAEWVSKVNRCNAQKRLEEAQLMESTREFCRESTATLNELLDGLPPINHGPDAKPVDEKTAKALRTIHEAVVEACSEDGVTYRDPTFEPVNGD